jgi:hypothetical protein
VCDVYDALVSRRAYRPAWSREDALALLHAESNVAFDPRCVAALERIVGAPVVREERASVLIGAAGAPASGRRWCRDPRRRRRTRARAR